MGALPFRRPAVMGRVRAMTLPLALAAVACRVPVPTAAPLAPEDAAAERAPAPVDRVAVDLGTLQLPVSWTGPDGVERSLDIPDLAAAPVTLPGPLRLGGKTHEGPVTLEAADRGTARGTVVLPLESYVAGVVAAELSLWSAHEEELCAQAIAARTYAVQALRRRGPGAALAAGVMDQAYAGSYVVPASSPSRGARAAAARLASAIERTRGVVLMRGSELEEARYHASCGGHTSSFADVFAGEAAAGAFGPLGVPCPPCRERAAAELRARRPAARRPLGWSLRLGPDDLDALGRALGLGGPLIALAPGKVDRGGRWLTALADGGGGTRREVTWEAVRRALGHGRVKGAMIVAQRPRAGAPITGDLLLQGLGRGHGVGLCQESIRDLAERGWDHRRILRHYYPGASFARVDGGQPDRE